MLQIAIELSRLANGFGFCSNNNVSNPHKQKAQGVSRKFVHAFFDFLTYYLLKHQ